jgi:hypothetical protein
VSRHSSATWATSLTRTNFSSTLLFDVPTTCRLPGRITEKISLTSTVLPLPFSRNRTKARHPIIGRQQNRVVALPHGHADLRRQGMQDPQRDQQRQIRVKDPRVGEQPGQPPRQLIEFQKLAGLTPLLLGKHIRIGQQQQLRLRHLIQQVPLVLRRRQELLHQAHETRQPRRRQPRRRAEEGSHRGRRLRHRA